MVWFLFRDWTSFEDQLLSGRRPKSLDEIFDLLLTLRDNPSRFVSQPKRFCRQSSRPYTEGPSSGGFSEKCRTNHCIPGPKLSTYPCVSCGMRFSPNLLQNGLCNVCRRVEESDTAHKGRSYRRGNIPVSDKELSDAYQTLGCDKNDPDEVIKNRRRELAKQFHADHLSQGASPDLIRNANNRFCIAQEAYEIIMISRKKET